MTRPFRLRSVWHECITGPAALDEYVADMEDSTDYPEQIKLLGCSETDNIQRVLRVTVSTVSDGLESRHLQRCPLFSVVNAVHFSPTLV